MITIQKFFLALTAALLSALLALPASAQISTQKLKTQKTPALDLAIPCANPAITRAGIKLEKATLNDTKTQIVLDGCFGLNQAKRLGVWLRKNTGTAANPVWSAPVEGRSVSWNRTQARVTVFPIDSAGANEIQATVVRDPNSDRYQLTQWQKVTMPSPPPPPLTGPVDADGDGSYSVQSGGDDCDDGDPNRYPGNTEVADNRNHDEDCDPSTFGNRDADGDGYYDSRACNSDSAGNLICGTDCDDSRSDVHPHQVDPLTGRDNDCDGAIDEDQTLEFLKQQLGL